MTGGEEIARDTDDLRLNAGSLGRYAIPLVPGHHFVAGDVKCMANGLFAAEKAYQYYCVINKHSDVELFCGNTAIRARPTGEALRGIYRRPGESRGACRPARSGKELLQRALAPRRAQEHRTDGGPTGA